MTARGNDEFVGKAKNALTAASIGLVILISAYAITKFVMDRLPARQETTQSIQRIDSTLECCCRNIGMRYECASATQPCPPNESWMSQSSCVAQSGGMGPDPSAGDCVPTNSPCERITSLSECDSDVSCDWLRSRCIGEITLGTGNCSSNNSVVDCINDDCTWVPL